MKKIILAGVAVISLGVMFTASAEARDGCGPHRFRADNGRCYWMRHAPPPPDYYYDDAPPPPPVYFGLYGGPFGWGGGGWHHGWHH